MVVSEDVGECDEDSGEKAGERNTPEQKESTMGRYLCNVTKNFMI